MEGALPIGNSLRLATITDVEKTFVLCRYLGKICENSFECPLPHPYVGKGSGILTGVERDSIVLVSEGPGEERFIIAFVPIRTQFFDQEGIDDISFNNTPFPEIEEGQIILKASGKGSYIDIHPDGNIVLDAGAGDTEADFELSSDSRALFLRVDNKYGFTETGRSTEGVVKRDKSAKEDPLDTTTFDFLSGKGYDRLLETIGRMSKYEIANSTVKMARDFVRNPALVEKRSIVYEYADSFGVGKLIDEVNEMTSVDKKEEIVQLGLRQNRRTDVLNLNMLNYNHLIEKVEGTLVDIYGNVLDINRNKIEIPDLETLGLSENIKKAVQTIYSYMRRSVKYHFEINSRKDIPDDEPTRGKDTIDHREHSRLSVDIDGEGLTKINIPRSSKTGNIPVLGRYLTSRKDDDKESGSFRDKEEKDIRMSAFGASGPEISNSAYIPETMDESTITAGTAYHDLMSVANIIFSSGKWGKRADGTGTPDNRMSESINNKIGDAKANAGGRSLNANLDGSAEISIGADTIDSKSLLLDLEGGVISHYGTDINGRSIIHQSDGTVLIQIGSSNGNSGRLEIHLANSNGSQKIIIDEEGLTIDVTGNMILNAGGSIGINAGANLLLQGSNISFHGSVDASPEGARTVNVGGTVMLPTGSPEGGPYG